MTNVITQPNQIAAFQRQRLTPKALPKPKWAGRESKVEFVRIGEVEEHPMPRTADLEVTKVHGYPVVIGKGEFKAGDIAIYLPVGAKVPLHPQLDFIHHGRERNRIIQTRNFRFVTSCGVLLPAWEYMQLNDDYTGATIRAEQNCWNEWLAPMVGADASALIGAENPSDLPWGGNF